MFGVRAKFEEFTDSIRDILRENERLKTENTKLLEYAKLLVPAVESAGCDICPYANDFELCDVESDLMNDGCKLYEELKALGCKGS